MTETNDASPNRPGPDYFTDPERAEFELGQIRHMVNLLEDLYAGRIQRDLDMRGWIHEKASRLAKAATALADSEVPPDPERQTGTWISPGDVPWIRDTAVCPFCGSPDLKLAGDESQRIDAYCDSPNCDARELVVLVLRDGHEGRAAERSDVRRLLGPR